MNQVNDNLARAEKLGCYCILWDKDPEHLKNKQVPEGYCGLCETCGRPGHTRHFPGAVPYTGPWCDRPGRQGSGANNTLKNEVSGTCLMSYLKFAT